MTTPTKAPSIVLSPRLGGGRTLESVARRCLEHTDANEPLLDAHGDHEALHQFRVGYRRLRSLFSSRARSAGPILKHGGSRPSCVSSPSRSARLATSTSSSKGTRTSAPPTQRLEDARVTAYSEALEFLHSPEWAQTRVDLDEWLRNGSYRDLLGTGTWSGRAWTAGALERRRKRIRTMSRRLADLSDHDRHQLRIEAKKVRYGCQFFGTMWPRTASDALVMEKTSVPCRIVSARSTISRRGADWSTSRGD